MSYSSRLQALARSMSLITRRVWPAAIGGVGAYVLLQTEASRSFVNSVSLLARGLVTFIGNETSKGGLLVAKAEREYKCQDIVGHPRDFHVNNLNLGHSRGQGAWALSHPPYPS